MAQVSKNGNVGGDVNVQRGGQENIGEGQRQGGVGSPITNEAYNVISALHAKLEGLEAYRKYAKDGDAQVWKNLTQVELQGVQQLVDELEKMVKEGKFRLREAGKANA